MKRSGRHYLFNLQARGDWVRLRTLLTLRWLAVVGQLVAVLAASQGMGFQLPLIPCALLISASVSINVMAYLIFPSEKRLNERGTLLSLFYDLGQLVTLLGITGGLNNPFAVLVIAPVTISATALRLQSTLWLGIAGMASVTLMSTVYLPLVRADGSLFEAPELYRSGVAAALAISIAFLAVYARRVTVEGYAMSQALTATQIALSREQRLAAIGGIAAATAHELGTPLATIKLVAGELARDLKDHPELAEDIALIRREAQRCGEILADLSRGGRDDSHMRNAPISAVVAEAAGPHAKRGKRVLVRFNGVVVDTEHGGPGEEQPLVTRSPELIHGLRNLIQNAVDFAESTVWVDIDLSDTELRIAVGDDGPGFRTDLLPRLGEPYVSTRRRGEKRETTNEDDDESSGYEGMGLGLFIARTLLQRTGALVSFANGSDARRRRRDAVQDTPSELAHPPGAIVELIWPLSALVTPKAVARGPLGRNKRFRAES